VLGDEPQAILGETFDIHGGGLDLVFPHHENEIAQSECCHGKPMVKYWMHNGLLMRAAAGRARSAAAASARSRGDGGHEDQPLERGRRPGRLIAGAGGERSASSCCGRTTAARSSTAFYRYFERFHKVTRQRFSTCRADVSRGGRIRSRGTAAAGRDAPPAAELPEKMDDDFNTGGALADLFDMVRELNKFANEKNLDRFADLSPQDADYAARLKALYANPDVQLLVRATTVLRELANLLGLFRQTPAKRGGAGEGVVPKVMELLIELRAEARGRKDFATGDKIRNRLAEIGVTLEDRKGGATEWRMGAGS
jgi:cysteinyl-tRNA synthetase